MENFKKLFEPIMINKTMLKNRIAIPPMGTSAVTPDGMITDELVAYFDSMSSGGAGLVVMEVADIDQYRRYNSTVVGIFNDDCIPGWTRVADAVHKNGAKLFAQLLHAGPIPLIQNDPTQSGPICASTVPHIYNLNSIPKAITKEDMEEIKQMYVDAARRVIEAGCDGIEIHCAHNHGLLGTFVSQIHNKRTDEYGGDLRGRMKYPLEVIKAVRDFVGPDFPIGIRMSGAFDEVDGLTIEDSCRMAKMFEAASVDYLHVSNGSLLSSFKVMPPHGTPKAVNIKHARAIKEAVNIPVGCVGRISDAWTAEECLEAGDIDIAFMGRAQIVDPELAKKVASGREDDVRPCIGCNECTTAAMYGNGFFCTMNTRAGHELDDPIVYSKENENKTVLIAGGGPGGLEAARVAALRGFKVILAEAKDHLGGQFELAAYPPTKQDYACGVKYQIQQVYKAGVKVLLNQKVTKGFVEEIKPDAVIIATGGTPVMPQWLLDSPQKNIMTAWDAIKGSPAIGKNIVIIGGGMVGCECADMIAAPHFFMNQGERRVTIIEMLPNVMIEDVSPQRQLLMSRLIDKHVNILEGAKVEEISEDTVVYSQDGETHTLKHVDTIISAMGTKADNFLCEELKDLTIPVYTIGDAVKPRKIRHATYEGYVAARKL